jgi:hypothetical protein
MSAADAHPFEPAGRGPGGDPQPGHGADEIGVSGNAISYEGIVIGTVAGGVGGTLTVTFNAAATVEAVDALIQNLTYANASNAPIASHELVLNVRDGDGAWLGGQARFAQLNGAANPFSGRGRRSQPFAELRRSRPRRRPGCA